MNAQAAELLAEVEKSPAAVAVHDKAAWMSIFAKYHIVEDPVGSRPHVSGVYDGASGERGNGPLSRFYDTFIAPNQIAFDITRDLVCGNHVVRDLTIRLQMSDKVDAQVPMHLLYELQQQDGEWKIVRLAAHWELLPMIGQLLGKGWACAGVLMGLSWRMLKLQGLVGMLGFSKAALNIGNAGKRVVEDFAEAFNRKNLAGVMACFSGDAASIALPYGETMIEPSHLLDKVNGQLSLSKLLAAGDTISASCALKQGETIQEGVVLFEFNRKRRKISRVRFYF